LSSAEYRLRVARRMARTRFSAVSHGPDFYLIVAPFTGCNEPAFLRWKNPSKCLMNADGGQSWPCSIDILALGHHVGRSILLKKKLPNRAAALSEVSANT